MTVQAIRRRRVHRRPRGIVAPRGPQDTYDWARILERQMARLPSGRLVVAFKAFDELQGGA